jgi:hypothetical protein
MLYLLWHKNGVRRFLIDQFLLNLLKNRNDSANLRGFLWSFLTSLFFMVRSCYPTPNPQAGGPPLVCCPRLLIQHIHSYPPKLEGVSSIRNLRTRHAVVTRDPPNMVTFVTV